MTTPLIIDDRELGSFKVNRRVFTDPEILRQERVKIFDRTWIYAAHESELKTAGAFVARSVAGRSVIVVRGDDGNVRVLLNTCTHRGVPVCQTASGCTRAFRCPYHGWTFSNEGRLIGLPQADSYSDALDRDALALVSPPRVESYRGFIFISFNPAIESLVEYLKDAKDYLDLVCDQSEGGMEVVAGTHFYCTRANWKLVIENNIDLYHVPTVHKRYFDYAIGAGGDRNTLRRTGRGVDLHNGHAAVESSPPAGGRLVAYWGPPFPESMRGDIEQRRRRIEERFGRERADQMTQYNRNLIVFPNLIINDAISVVIRSSFPVSEDYVEITAWALAGVGESPEDRRMRIDSFLTFLGPGGFGTPDDTELLESCQRAFANKEVVWSDISKGAKREAPRHDDELQIRAFWRRWHELMGAGA